VAFLRKDNLMKYDTALYNLKTEDNFYDQASKAFDVYQKSGGTILTQDEFLKLFSKHVAAQHIARKEKEFKERSKVSNKKIKEQILDYFKGR
jgi:hypothetical protein